MKHLITLCFLVFLTVSGFSQQIQSIKYEQGYAGPWQNAFLNSYTYDTNGNVSNMMEDEWDAATSSWKNFRQINYTYNPAGTWQQYVSKAWDTWSGNPPVWIDAQRVTKTYSSGKVQSMLVEGWDLTNWIPQTQVDYTYDSNGYLISMHQKSWNSSLSILEDRYLYTFTINSGGSVLQRSVKEWEPSLQSWNDLDRHHFTYNAAGQELTDSSEQVVNGAWVTGIKVIHNYDANSKLAEVLHQNRDNNSWVTTFDFDYTYYGNGVLDQISSQAMTLAGWENNERETYTYINHQSVTARPEALSTALALYPNPSADRILVQLPEEGITNLSVIDLQGKTISTKVAFGKTSILDISKLSAGTYLLRADGPAGITTTKFTRQ